PNGPRLSTAKDRRSPPSQTKPVGLTESFGAPSQTPGRLRRKIVPGRPEAERSEAAGPEPTQPNWIQTNLTTKRRDQTGALIES
ncbi:MAG: hypothetical protein GY696_16295, partial [Gammaproteobacteria bacterium]|nr:hypothetical protein [Gammaproteobacteria bacterium]